MSVTMKCNEKRMGSGKHRLRWVVAVGVALVGAMALGAIAGWVRNDAFWTWFAVFTSATFPALAGLSWVLIVRPIDPGAQPDPHAEESIEAAWANKAATGAFLDLLIVLGLATAATSILGQDSLPSILFLAIAMADFLLRMLILRWR